MGVLGLKSVVKFNKHQFALLSLGISITQSGPLRICEV